MMEISFIIGMLFGFSIAVLICCGVLTKLINTTNQVIRDNGDIMDRLVAVVLENEE